MTKHSDKFPEVIEKSEDEIADIIKTIQESDLPTGIKELVTQCIELSMWFPRVLQSKRISLNRLRKIIFGKGYLNRRKNNDDPLDDDSAHDNTDASSTEESKTTPDSSGSDTTTSGIEKTKQSTLPESSNDQKPGHGRMPHTIYQADEEILLKIAGLQSGDPCPSLCSGILRPYGTGAFIRVHGQNIARVVRYKVQKLRCTTCTLLVVAEIPPEVGNEKYDAAFKAILVLQKYYMAVPFYRQEFFQRLLNFPLPDSTQWDLVEKVAGCCYRVYNHLIFLAANGHLLHSDDTPVKILEVINAIIKGTWDSKRVGMFTSGVIAVNGEHKIALFLNGTKHAGENVSDILIRREPDQPPIIRMCDASDNNNITPELEGIVCNCLGHGFRKFEELVDYFPTECMNIMKMLGEVYDNDAHTKENDMTDETRLTYHKDHSTLVMTKLKSYMASLLDDHLVENNSELGKSIHYMQNHWSKLTKFLTVAGAPLDNNIVERALKVAIRNRKSAMFYRSCYSAHIGGMLTSLIYTCVLSNANPLDYLTMLQKYHHHNNDNPEQWMPWNYRETLQTWELTQQKNEVDASPKGRSPPEDCLVAA